MGSPRQKGLDVERASRSGRSGEHRLDHAQSLVRVAHGDVHVHPEAGLAAQGIAEGGSKLAIAIAHGEWLEFGQRERMRTGPCDPQAELRAHADDALSEIPQLVLGGDDGRVWRGCQFDLTLHELRLDALVRDRGHQLLHAGRQGQTVCIEQHQLLLDAERVFRSRSEAVCSHRNCLLRLGADCLHPASPPRVSSMPRQNPSSIGVSPAAGLRLNRNERCASPPMKPATAVARLQESDKRRSTT